MVTKAIRLLFAALLLLGLLVAATGAVADTPLVGEIEVDEALFWDGGTVEPGGPSLFLYRFATIEPGHRLRVAIDHPSRPDTFRLRLRPPGGQLVGTVTTGGAFNAELFATNPPVGTWTVEVEPVRAEGSTFRLRAKLEAAPPPKPAEPELVPPNMRVVPPFEFGFVAPAHPLNGPYLAGDGFNPPLSVAGQRPLSCSWDETVEFLVVRCLRFTSGPVNAGDGPLEVRFYPASEEAVEAPMYQVVHLTSGPPVVRRAGHYEFHATHAHYHYTDILTYQLLRVTDPEAGVVEPAGDGHKSGFCPVDQLIADWYVFDSAAKDAFTGNCGYGATGSMTLSPGWGDVYRWQRPGQFVDFGLANGDGFYVVQAIVDIEDHILESDETDNTSYAYIRVTGTDVEIFERGIGHHPWDPHKIVVDDRRGPAEITDEDLAP